MSGVSQARKINLHLRMLLHSLSFLLLHWFLFLNENGGFNWFLGEF
jgi:hypothetical protein